MSQENTTILFSLLEDSRLGLILYARNLCGREAEDVVQEAFLRLLEETPPPRSPKAWLYRVVRNLAIDQTRREKRTASFSDFGSDHENWFEPCSETAGFAEGLTEALSRLAEDVREIVLSKIWGNLTFREIAELTGRPISSVHLDYQQGLDQLRTLLKEE